MSLLKLEQPAGRVRRSHQTNTPPAQTPIFQLSNKINRLTPCSMLSSLAQPSEIHRQPVLLPVAIADRLRPLAAAQLLRRPGFPRRPPPRLGLGQRPPGRRGDPVFFGVVVRHISAPVVPPDHMAAAGTMATGALDDP